MTSRQTVVDREMFVQALRHMGEEDLHYLNRMVVERLNLLAQARSTVELAQFADERRIREARVRLARTASTPDLDWQIGVRRMQDGGDTALVGGFGTAGLPHPRIATPQGLYGAHRTNSRGLDLSNENTLTELAAALQATAAHAWKATPLLGTDTPAGPNQPVRNPADHSDVVGNVQEATTADVDQALAHAEAMSRSKSARVPKTGSTSQ